jgi:hypothetical protein
MKQFFLMMLEDIRERFDFIDGLYLVSTFIGLSFMAWVAYKVSLFGGVLGAVWITSRLLIDFSWVLEPEDGDDDDDRESPA